MTSDLLLMIIPAILIVVGVLIWRKGRYLLENGKNARATIIDSVFEPSRDGGGFHYPVVRFQTDKQEWITRQLNIGYSSAKKTSPTQYLVVCVERASRKIASRPGRQSDEMHFATRLPSSSKTDRCPV